MISLDDKIEKIIARKDTHLRLKLKNGTTIDYYTKIPEIMIENKNGIEVYLPSELNIYSNPSKKTVSKGIITRYLGIIKSQTSKKITRKPMLSEDQSLMERILKETGSEGITIITEEYMIRDVMHKIYH